MALEQAGADRAICASLGTEIEPWMLHILKSGIKKAGSKLNAESPFESVREFLKN